MRLQQLCVWVEMKYKLKNMGFGYQIHSRLYNNMETGLKNKISNQGKMSQDLNEKIQVHIIGRTLSPQFFRVYQSIHSGILQSL